jgi:hypothetical protein
MYISGAMKNMMSLVYHIGKQELKKEDNMM